MREIKYIRVSTLGQNTERQENTKDSMIDKCSGSIPFNDRKQGSKLLTMAKDGKVSTVRVHSIDRLGRNTIDIMQTIQLFTSLGVNVVSEKEGLNTLLPDGKENPTAKMIISIMATLSEFELTLIKERQREGIANAKAKGVYKDNGGNKPVETTAKFLSKAKNSLCAKELRNGNSLRRSSKISGVSVMTAQKVKKLIAE